MTSAAKHIQPMTRARLEQFVSLKREINMLEDRLSKDQAAADTVKGSMLMHPYTQHTITIIGKDTKTARLLRQRYERLTSEGATIEQYIDQLPDSHMRALITMRYVYGLPWATIAANVGNNTEDSVRKAVERFFRRT